LYPLLNPIAPLLALQTDAGVLFLDPDVFVSCTDISFAQNVWRSGSDAAVGFFPRIHRCVSKKAELHSLFHLHVLSFDGYFTSGGRASIIFS
jgi:hypothetical protein